MTYESVLFFLLIQRPPSSPRADTLFPYTTLCRPLPPAPRRQAAVSDSGMPHIVVASIVERDGRFLIVEERINGASLLNQPAGQWERGETLVEGSIREALEETGWDVRPTHVLGTIGRASSRERLFQ